MRLVKRLESEKDDARATDLGLILLEQAQLLEGASLEDPVGLRASRQHVARGRVSI